MKTALDHIAVSAPDLRAGADFVERALGVRPRPGGAHARMGTHNLLLRLGPDVYLEVIAPDPAAPRPQRPRWFELDRLGPACAPRLATWVARTDDIAAARAAAGPSQGEVEPMQRGALSWRITIPADGSLPGNAGGAMPTLIQWDAEPHPAAVLDDLGCTLEGLDVFHPEPARLRAMLDAIGYEGAVVSLHFGETPRLQARVRTPHGLRMLPAAAAPDGAAQ